MVTGYLKNDERASKIIVKGVFECWVVRTPFYDNF